jgi:hypothetical protein
MLLNSRPETASVRASASAFWAKPFEESIKMPGRNTTAKKDFMGFMGTWLSGVREKSDVLKIALGHHRK